MTSISSVCLSVSPCLLLFLFSFTLFLPLLTGVRSSMRMATLCLAGAASARLTSFTRRCLRLGSRASRGRSGRTAPWQAWSVSSLPMHCAASLVLHMPRSPAVLLPFAAHVSQRQQRTHASPISISRCRACPWTRGPRPQRQQRGAARPRCCRWTRRDTRCSPNTRRTSASLRSTAVDDASIGFGTFSQTRQRACG